MTGIVVVLAAVGLVLLLFVFQLFAGHSGGEETSAKPVEATDAVRLSAEERFESREYVFSRAEASFYGALNLALGAGFLAFPKVRMADVLQPVQSGREGKKAFCEISQKHVDFVICREGTWAIVGAVELDDASHRRSDRQARDFFVNVVFSGAGIPLVRVPVQPQYSVQELRAKLAMMMGSGSGAKEAQLRMELTA